MACIRSALALTAVALFLGCSLGVDAHGYPPRTFIIGGEQGWSNGYSNFTEWQQTTSLRVGDIVVFKYQWPHAVSRFRTQNQFIACNEAQGTLISPYFGFNVTSFGTRLINITVTSRPQYFFCNTGDHCTLGMKVKIKAQAKKDTLPAPAPLTAAPGHTPLIWVEGGYDNANTTVWMANVGRKLKVGAKVEFVFKCCHNVFQFKNKTAYEACDFTGATYLGASPDTLDSPPIPNYKPVVVTKKRTPQYFGCAKQYHCFSGMKVMI